MNKLLIGSAVLIGVALAAVAVSGSREITRAHPTRREKGVHPSAAGPARCSARLEAPGHFLPGRAGLPQ